MKTPKHSEISRLARVGLEIAAQLPRMDRVSEIIREKGFSPEVGEYDIARHEYEYVVRSPDGTLRIKFADSQILNVQFYQ
jgi:hypothetical protein